MHLPALLSVRELAPLWGVSVSQMHLLNRKCALDLFKVHPAIGPRRTPHAKKARPGAG